MAQIRNMKSIVALRKLHEDFGHLFCRQVTVGGRLLTSKVLHVATGSSEQAEKSEYKLSVSASVSTPYVDASVKHDRSGESGSEGKKASSDSAERHAFEAVGGDTTLAAKYGRQWSVPYRSTADLE